MMDAFDSFFGDITDPDEWLDWGGQQWEWEWMQNDQTVADNMLEAGHITDGFYDLISNPTATMDVVIAEACLCPDFADSMRDFFDINDNGTDLDEAATVLQIVSLVGLALTASNPVGLGIFVAIGILGLIAEYVAES
ncbi:hypothetical protein [Fretibacter rubidus]|uniref:hypothetical protein n=1 Tax=Fretibacter rubidus TaxID=570162 RepID=UPI00352B56B5